MGTLGRKAVWGAVVALSVLVPAASASASGNLLNVDKLLQGVSSGSPRQIIVRTRPDARDRVKKRLPNRGPGPVEHKLISAFTAAMDAHEIAVLASNPDILSVSAAVFDGDNIVWGTML